MFSGEGTIRADTLARVQESQIQLFPTPRKLRHREPATLHDLYYLDPTTSPPE
jgi:hypothetical protein